ncbi:MAG TPA: hypothetical protein DHV12_10430 [Thermotogae bacterium]|nr:hypothetical protein [Thermotogota bacterium]HCZ07521.1 hypothetical protein [Thermotogota bacterium]
MDKFKVLIAFLAVISSVTSPIGLANLKVDAIPPYFDFVLDRMIYEVRVSGSLEGVEIQEFHLEFTMEGFVDYTFGRSPVFSRSWSYSKTSSTFHYIKKHSIPVQLGGHYYLNICLGDVSWVFRTTQVTKIGVISSDPRPLSEIMTERDRDSAKVYFWYDPEEWPFRTSLLLR